MRPAVAVAAHVLADRSVVRIQRRREHVPATAVADRHDMEMHPDALKLDRRSLNLIDADLRNPTLTRSVAPQAEAGLAALRGAS